MSVAWSDERRRSPENVVEERVDWRRSAEVNAWAGGERNRCLRAAGSKRWSRKHSAIRGVCTSKYRIWQRPMAWSGIWIGRGRRRSRVGRSGDVLSTATSNDPHAPRCTHVGRSGSSRFGACGIAAPTVVSMQRSTCAVVADVTKTAPMCASSTASDRHPESMVQRATTDVAHRALSAGPTTPPRFEQCAMAPPPSIPYLTGELIAPGFTDPGD
jgi:hypothetical protein